MSYTFTLEGASNVLSASYHPPIELNPSYSYALGLIGLHTYNSIPNITEKNNKFYYDDDGKVITIPPGAYEISDIEAYLRDNLVEPDSDESKETILSLKPNGNTLKCELKSRFAVNFTPEDSIGRRLGFSAKILKANELHESDLPVRIIKVATVRVECNITTGAYSNARLSHVLYEFATSVPPGFIINIEPTNIIYLPIHTKSIENITIKLTDQDGDLIDFRGERVLIRLELKRLLN